MKRVHWLNSDIEAECREKPLVGEKPCTQKQKLDNTQGVTGTNACGSPSPTPELPSPQCGAFEAATLAQKGRVRQASYQEAEGERN